MRKWYKYGVNKENQHDLELSIDKNFQEHQKAMGGYDTNSAYSNKESFLRTYFEEDEHYPYRYYQRFLDRHLKKQSRILFIASGRCVNECKLLDDGFDIVCSDLDRFNAYDATMKMFPSLKFMMFLRGQLQRSMII